MAIITCIYADFVVPLQHFSAGGSIVNIIINTFGVPHF